MSDHWTSTFHFFNNLTEKVVGKLPAYKSTATIHASRIKQLLVDGDNNFRILTDDNLTLITKPGDHLHKRINSRTDDLGYIMFYPDGFVSWIPSSAFTARYVPA